MALTSPLGLLAGLVFGLLAAFVAYLSLSGFGRDLSVIDVLLILVWGLLWFGAGVALVYRRVFEGLPPEIKELLLAGASDEELGEMIDQLADEIQAEVDQLSAEERQELGWLLEELEQIRGQGSSTR